MNHNANYKDLFDSSASASCCCCAPCLCSVYNIDENQQAIVETFTSRKLLNGPRWFCIPCFPPLFSVRTFRKKELKSDEYVEIEDWDTHDLTIMEGPTILMVDSPYDRPSEVMKKIQVPLNHFARLRNKDGSLENIIGPCLYCPKPFQRIVLSVRPIPMVHANEYTYLFDRETRTYRCIVGPATFVPSANEEFVAFENNRPVFSEDLKISRAVEVNALQAVHVRDLETGTIRMITEPQRFIPKISEVVQKTVNIQTLEVNEFQVVLNTVTGERSIKRYDVANTRAFFLGPADKFIEFQGAIASDGTHKNPVRMNMRNNRIVVEGTYRTSDNVLIDISTVIVYNVHDVEQFCLVSDVYQSLAWDWTRGTMSRVIGVEEHRKVFSSAPQMVSGLLPEAQEFFSKHGMEAVNVQLGALKCANADIQRVLDKFVQETTDRTNAVLRERSESTIAMERIQREVTVETERRKLVEIQRENMVKEAQAKAEAANAEQKRRFEVIREFAGEKALDVYRVMAEVDKARAISEKIKNAILTPESMMLKMVTPQAMQLDP